jgi:hypothetical protein
LEDERHGTAAEKLKLVFRQLSALSETETESHAQMHALQESSHQFEAA